MIDFRSNEFAVPNVEQIIGGGGNEEKRRREWLSTFRLPLLCHRLIDDEKEADRRADEAKQTRGGGEGRMDDKYYNSFIARTLNSRTIFFFLPMSDF